MKTVLNNMLPFSRQKTFDKLCNTRFWV